MISSVFNVIQPTTYTITFDNGNRPKLFQVYNEEGELYYFRHLDGKTTTINVNFPEDGSFHTDADTQFTIIKSKPLERKGQEIILPKPDRNYKCTGLKIEVNPKLGTNGTPARIFPKIGVIEMSPKLMLLPYPLRLFILLHEQGHCMYSSEYSCDLYALKQYLYLGYNASMAYYAMSHILKQSPENVKRIKVMFKNVMNFS